ncbi:29864_t:CDS:2, partial [Gigaspora margarita]
MNDYELPTSNIYLKVQLFLSISATLQAILAYCCKKPITLYALLNELNVLDISKNLNDPDIESNSSSSDQSTLQNNGVTVITNSLSKRIRKKKFLLATKNQNLVKVGCGIILDEIKLKKKYCKVKTTNEDKTEASSANSSFFASFYDDNNDILIANKNLSLVKKEVALYDNLSQILKYHITDEKYSKVNPLTKWNEHKEALFPFHSQLARKYLAFLAISVPSERIFSDADNTINNKRNQLDPNT